MQQYRMGGEETGLSDESQSLQRTAETARTKKKKKGEKTKGEGHSEAGRLSAAFYLSFQGVWDIYFCI